MIVRKYQPGEESQLWQLFFDTVRTVNLRDYSPEQVRAWAPDQCNEERWRTRIENNKPFVCVHDPQIVGFADVQPTGYIDHFFVHRDWQGKGVARLLFATLEAEAHRQGLPELFANVSITARPFFESRGFQVTVTQDVNLGTVTLRNYRMVKRMPNMAVNALIDNQS